MSGLSGRKRGPRSPLVRQTLTSVLRESLNDRPPSARNSRGSSGSSNTRTDITKAGIEISGRRDAKTVARTEPNTRKQYPLRSKHVIDANLEFYKNQMRSKPGGHKIEEMLKWEKNYDRLEKNHRYIQWLFPLPGSRGMNPAAQPLEDHEAKTIRSTKQLKNRVLKAFKMMLDFYGMELECSDTGKVRRSKNWIPRFKHLNTSFHNYLRISRILQSLGCLGFEHYQYPWLHFILEEAVINKTLPNLDCSAVSHWIKALNNDSERDKILSFYIEIKHGKPVKADEMDYEMSEEENGDEDDDLEEEQEEENGGGGSLN